MTAPAPDVRPDAATDPHADMLMDHEYDGIREYDNPLPGWWTWLWIASIVFSIVYYPYFHFGAGPTIEDEYQASVAKHVEKLLAQLGDIQGDNATILQYMTNDEWMTAAEGMFVGNCSQCHAADGGGNVGPNLTDDYYKNVSEPADIFTVITDGVTGTGMNAWKDRMSEPQRILLSAYVARLRGRTAAVPKEQEGSRLPAWETFATSDASEAPLSNESGADADPPA